LNNEAPIGGTATPDKLKGGTMVLVPPP